jgi:thioredoxin 1
MAEKKTFNDIINGDKPVLIDFYAEWCGPCKMMPPILSQLKSMTGDKASIIKIDIDKNPDVARMYRIQSVPTIAIFKRGQIIWKESGVRQAAELNNILSQHY